MHKNLLFLILLIVTLPLSAFAEDAAQTASPFETITFASTDGLEVTADLYMPHEATAPFIVLCHQARWSRGEYREIAPKLNEMGFNCLAIDQRSGEKVNSVVNETAQRAATANLGTEYPDAEPDILAAIQFAHDNYAEGDLILWGSSYSAALALKIAGDQPDLVDGVLAFAPGEYFANYGKSASYVTDSAQNLTAPVFITSAKNEQPNWQPIFDAIPSADKASFVPETAGNHGSRALWEQFEDSAAYWDAVSAFLDQFSR